MKCECCQKEAERLITTKHDHVCNDCLDYYEECAHCKQLVHYMSLWDTPNGDVCKECFDEYYEQCALCDNRFLSKDGVTTEFGLVCPNCASK